MSEEEYAAITAKAKLVGGLSALLRDHASRITIRNRKQDAEVVRILRRFDGHFSVLCQWCDANATKMAAVEIAALLISIDRELSRLAKTIIGS